MANMNPFPRIRQFLIALALTAIAGMGFGAAEASAANALAGDSCSPGTDNCWFAASCNECCVSYFCISTECDDSEPNIKCWRCEQC